MDCGCVAALGCTVCLGSRAGTGTCTGWFTNGLRFQVGYFQVHTKWGFKSNGGGALQCKDLKKILNGGSGSN